MKIESLEISNFKAVKSAHLANLGGLIVIAGQNGSGKSAIFDAIRLLKSAYGGYQASDEFQQWLGEMHIDFRDSKSVLSLFNNKKDRLLLRMTLTLHKEEKDYLKKNAANLMALNQQAQRAWGIGDMRSRFMSKPMGRYQKSVASHESELVKALVGELDQNHLTAELVIEPSEVPVPNVRFSLALGTLFTNFVPNSLGVIDFHGPHRLYVRERLDSINVNLQSLEDQRRNTLLFNPQQKYSNIKNELAAVRLRELLADAAGSGNKTHHDLINTLQDLFSTFFPGKEFLGPRPTPDGKLTFPVKVGDTIEHDLDELSAGEKEILYGYLRLRNAAPKNSVILIDEPELHLNPKLIRKLPDFYYRNLASNFSNQVWLVTHADALLRDVLGRTEYSVFHMRSPPVKNDLNQAQPITIEKDLDETILDLVGNLAAYSPDSKLVIFEGDTDSEFDVRMTTELFPEFASQVNCVSGTNKARVRGLYALLTHLHEKKALNVKVYAITDRDSEALAGSGTTEFTWDVYHIENYLLEPRFVAAVTNEVLGPTSHITAAEAQKNLHKCASRLLPALVQNLVGHEINRSLVETINTKIDPKSPNAARDLTTVVTASSERIRKLATLTYTEKEVRRLIAQKTKSYKKDLRSKKWLKSMKGRDILREYVKMTCAGHASYQTFRNLILARMRDGKFKPNGMKTVLEKILTDG